WEMVEHNGAATILPVLPDRRVILVQQYRYPIRKSIWELPAGRIEPGETPMACAQREIKEEIGLTARRMTKLISFYSTPGFTNEKIHIFLARGLKPARATPDPDEDIRTGCFTAREIKQMINQKRIVDAKTLIGLTLWLQNLI
ncbi:MAG: NUDIX hydrolase, partial [Planctomycetes bacterium]|nr:NUDIX hydrolase [Planctomycetota bacterium]